jgi:hypothetical protein
MNARRLLIQTPLVIAAVLLSTAGPARAGQIDNDTDPQQAGGRPDVNVWFDCGVGCGNYWTIPPQQSVGRHGVGGKVQAGAWDSQEPPWPICEGAGNSSRLSVGEHGEVGVAFVQIKFNENGSYKSGGTFSWTDKGGNPWSATAPITRQGGYIQNTQYVNSTYGCWKGTP